MRSRVRRIERQFGIAARCRPVLGKSQKRFTDTAILPGWIDGKLADRRDVVSMVVLAGGVAIARIKRHGADDFLFADHHEAVAGFSAPNRDGHILIDTRAVQTHHAETCERAMQHGRELLV
jgi:hypothetical protein